MPLGEQLKEANRAVGVHGSLLVSAEGEVLAGRHAGLAALG